MAQSDDATVTKQHSASNASHGDVFVIRPPSLPSDVTPIFDAQMDAVIGYQHQSAGWVSVYDLDAKEIERREQGLGKPLIDPIDLILLFGGAAQTLVKGGIRLGARVLTGKSAAFVSEKVLSTTTAATLRSAMRKVYLGDIKFAAAPGTHMDHAARHVPVHILRLAIKYGRKGADPRNAAGAMRYTTAMQRNGNEYMLEVVFNHTTNTVYHFKYWAAK